MVLDSCIYISEGDRPSRKLKEVSGTGTSINFLLDRCTPGPCPISRDGGLPLRSLRPESTDGSRRYAAQQSRTFVQHSDRAKRDVTGGQKRASPLPVMLFSLSHARVAVRGKAGHLCSTTIAPSVIVTRGQKRPSPLPAMLFSLSHAHMAMRDRAGHLCSTAITRSVMSPGAKSVRQHCRRCYSACRTHTWPCETEQDICAPASSSTAATNRTSTPS